MTRVIETDARDEEERWDADEDDLDPAGDDRGAGGGGWDDDHEDAIPPRPRGRLLRPLPLFLIAVAIAAAGFLGGVLAQKGSEGGGSGNLPGGGSLPSFAAGGPSAGGSEASGEGGESSTGVPNARIEAAGGEGAATGGEGATAEGATTEGATGLPSFGGSEAAASGTVTSVEGHTIYVKESDGTVVAVKVGDGATVTRNSDVNAKKIHPGDSVTVEGAKNGSTVKASSVAATESGVETTSGFGGPVTTTGGSGSEGEGGGSEAEASVESLFEE